MRDARDILRRYEPVRRFATCLLLLLAPAARADWAQLRAGGDPTGVIAAIGEPLIRSSSRSGVFQAWTYDAGGYAVFVGGRLDHWEAPRRQIAISRPVPTEAPRAETAGRFAAPSRAPVFKSVLVPRRGAPAR